MQGINGNEIANKVTLAEGKAKSISVAQVKEVLGCAACELVQYPPADVMKYLRRLAASREKKLMKAKKPCKCKKETAKDW